MCIYTSPYAAVHVVLIYPMLIGLYVSSNVCLRTVHLCVYIPQCKDKISRIHLSKSYKAVVAVECMNVSLFICSMRRVCSFLFMFFRGGRILCVISTRKSAQVHAVCGLL